MRHHYLPVVIEVAGGRSQTVMTRSNLGFPPDCRSDSPGRPVPVVSWFRVAYSRSFLTLEGRENHIFPTRPPELSSTTERPETIRKTMRPYDIWK